jgi:Cu2+-exporting ATPase
MDAAPALACAHCALPVGRFGRQREVDGRARWFCCYGCSLAYQVQHGADDEPQAAAALIRLGVGAFLTMFIMLFSLLDYAGAFRGDDAWLRTPVHLLQWALATPLLAVLGGPFFAGTWQGLRQRRLATDALVSLGVLAAYGYSVGQVLAGGAHVYFDTAAMVLGLFTVGRCLEAQGRVRAARSLAPLLAAVRAEVRCLADDGSEVLRAMQAVRPGALLRVLPGERIAVDGVVVDGRSACDESIVSGQPEPQAKSAGALVHAGALNGWGVLVVRATASGADSRWARVAAQVRDALAARSLAGATVERVVAVFIPGVLALAAATAAWRVASGSVDDALLAALAVLVVACPCSLGLAAPLAHALAIARCARRGILVRGGAVLEQLARLRGVAFDKTGTLTTSALQPRRFVVDEDADHAEALRVAGALARCSDHPASCAIAALAGADASPAPRIDDARALPGRGLLGRVDGRPCALGSAALFDELGWHVADGLRDAAAAGGATAVAVGWGGRARAAFALAAVTASDGAHAVAALRRRALGTLLLSGDVRANVEPLARELGLSDWRAGLLPEDKVAALRAWARERGGAVAMVGDGLNDGPVLAAAGVGIAVGGASDLARESADVVLPAGCLDALPWLLDEAQRVRRSVLANVAWAFGYNAVALTLAACGWLQPVFAAALMAGSSLVVAMRSWRASRRLGGEADLAASAAPPAAAAEAAAGA